MSRRSAVRIPLGPSNCYGGGWGGGNRGIAIKNRGGWAYGRGNGESSISDGVLDAKAGFGGPCAVSRSKGSGFKIKNFALVSNLVAKAPTVGLEPTNTRFKAFC